MIWHKHRHRFTSFGILLTAWLTLAACGEAAPSPSLPSPFPSPTASPSPTPSPTPKAPLRGLIDMGNIDFYNKPEASAIPENDPSEIIPFAPSFSGIVINVTWAQLQPDGPDPLPDNNVIDQALSAVAAYNEGQAPAQLLVKLRVWGGFVAPTWAKSLSDGPNTGPITIDSTNPNTGKHQTGTIGLFWSSPYIQAWRNLQILLAAKYDGNALIQEVAVTSCASDTDEPFVSWLDTTTIDNLHGFGYTDALQKTCLTGALEDYSAWTRTYIDFTYNLFHETDNVPIVSDSAFTLSVMQICQENPQCILSNHALNNPLLADDVFVYNQIETYFNGDPAGTLADYQTASPEQLDWCGAVANGISYHARSIELWPDFGGFTTLSPAILANLANALQSQTAPASSPCPPLP